MESCANSVGLTIQPPHADVLNARLGNFVVLPDGRFLTAAHCLGDDGTLDNSAIVRLAGVRANVVVDALTNPDSLDLAVFRAQPDRVAFDPGCELAPGHRVKPGDTIHVVGNSFRASLGVPDLPTPPQTAPPPNTLGSLLRIQRLAVSASVTAVEDVQSEVGNAQRFEFDIPDDIQPIGFSGSGVYIVAIDGRTNLIGIVTNAAIERDRRGDVDTALVATTIPAKLLVPP